MACFTSFFFFILASSRFVAGQDASDPSPTSISQSNTSMNQPQEIVGWVGNPRQRGTLMLLIECLTTIFACTWTVLHLNLPAPDDSTKTRVLRKIKWMAITILFPEFIFAKAVCELRLALYMLHLFSQKMNDNPDAFTSTADYTLDESVTLHIVFQWRAKRDGRMIRWLRNLLVGRQKTSGADSKGAQLGKEMPPGAALDAGQHGGRDAYLLHAWNVSPEITSTPPKDPYQGATAMEMQDPDIRLGGEEASAGPQAPDGFNNALKPKRKFVRQRPETQIWTLSHSYYLNMGGIHRLEVRGETRYVSPTPRYFVLRADSLVLQEAESLRVAHPLKDLRLSEDEIKDKSKADWIGKTVAILQIGRLGLDLINRAVYGRPVTQIELATVAFAIFAIVTYLINWWKPKDISEPTFLHPITSGKEDVVSNTVKYSTLTEPFFSRLLVPVPHERASVSHSRRGPNEYRIGNDELWMDGRLPLIWPLMAVSCLIFGAFHCIAWSFQFPTWAERLTWRVASLTSTGLPLLALTGSFLAIRYYNSALTIHQIGAVAEVAKAFEPLQGLFQEFGTSSLCAYMEGPLSRLSSVHGLSVESDWMAILKAGDRMRAVLSMLKTSKPGSRMRAEALSDCDHFCHGIRSIVERCSIFLGFLNLWVNEAEQGQDLEPDLIPCRQVISALETCVEQYDQFDSHGELHKYELAKRRLTDKARRRSRAVNIISGILYTVARVALLALMFSSLRAVPKGVYETSDWTRFLPSFS
ncbi:hypothetical protein QBC32DRAFT_337730 [Pseudoneurospora amorphoporcata]|uniref:Uncharacterized protein n=1 Tax=Pseudoneurospora amorphoporcata TaxID=241081 RepID=A0AAN6SI39_9PEZI|nr:hypothetical protein QBC32DRAFT_337730 [Pseudoneurospora amorphoporcata]